MLFLLITLLAIGFLAYAFWLLLRSLLSVRTVRVIRFTLLGISGATILALWALRMPVLEGRVFPFLVPWYTLLTPPSDVFDPIARVPVDLTAEGAQYRFELIHRYAGAYEVHLVAESDSLTDQAFQLFERVKAQRLRLACRAGESGEFNRVLDDSKYHLLGENEVEIGMLVYNVPSNLPRGKSQCILTITKGDAAFGNLYRGATLVIQRHFRL